jgi:hypothetical protein
MGCSCLISMRVLVTLKADRANGRGYLGCATEGRRRPCCGIGFECPWTPARAGAFSCTRHATGRPLRHFL